MDTSVEFDWDDIIRHHKWKDGKDTFDITILDIDPVNRKIYPIRQLLQPRKESGYPRILYVLDFYLVLD